VGAGGGSQPGAVLIADYLFTEPAGAHADLVATFTVPVGATVLDMWFYPIEYLWNDATAEFNAGDVAELTGYAAALNMNGGGMNENYRPDGSRGGVFVTSQDAGPGDYSKIAPWSSNAAALGGVLYPAGGTITMTMSGIAAGHGVNPAGVLLVRIVYMAAITAVAAA